MEATQDGHALEGQRLSSSVNGDLIALGVGFLLAFGEAIVLLLSGKDLVDAIWPHAVRSLDWTMMLRSNPTVPLSLMLVLAAACYVLRGSINHRPAVKRRVHIGLNVAIGLVLGLIALHFVMDVSYLRGAFLLLPTLIQTIRREAAVEVAVDVATVDGTSFGITDFKSQGKASGFQQIGLLTPLVDQPGPIDFIAVGATNHQHIAAGHHDASTST